MSAWTSVAYWIRTLTFKLNVRYLTVLGLSLAQCTREKDTFCLWTVKLFFPVGSAFRPRLLNDGLGISEINLKVPYNSYINIPSKSPVPFYFIHLLLKQKTP